MSEHILVTTVGAVPNKEKISYQSAKYHFEGEEQPREGKFFSPLLCVYLEKNGQPVQRAVVLLTSGAKEHPNWLGTGEEKGLKALLEELNITIEEVSIPDGKDADQLWEIFDAIGERIPQGTKVTLDITHGFRSLPLVMLLACAYFNASEKFTLAHVYYGAYVDQNTIASIVDLTPMLTLFEWANAVAAFKRGGSLRPMADLLEQRHETLYKQGVVNGKARLPLRPLADQMQSLMDAFELGRLRGINEPVGEIRRLAEEARRSAQRWEKPFVSQVDAILDQLRSFKVTDEDSIDTRLAAEFALVEWYYKNGLYIHAGLLLREWVISYVMSRSPEYRGKSLQEIFQDKDLREEVSNYLNNLSEQKKAISEIMLSAAQLAQKLNRLPDEFRAVVGIPAVEVHYDESAALGDTWNQLKELRNDLAHFGHRKKPFEAETIKEKVKTLIDRLKPLVPQRSEADPATE
ncbi:MAG: TIGR02221 family CRISPR-associated protein [Aggregatilineales bacterium]